uniref:Uncharacterized protein n=1 Tax=Rhizophora mucronata TaxID=61149 RepID=A0A2P2PW27_RHIMU
MFLLAVFIIYGSVLSSAFLCLGSKKP